MLDSERKPTAIDIVRSMERIGFSYEEIYDTLTGTGLPGGEVQHLMDRVEADIEGSGIESRRSRIVEEMEDLIERKIEEKETKTNSELRKINRDIKDVQGEIDSLEKRIEELQGLVSSIKDKR